MPKKEKLLLSKQRENVSGEQKSCQCNKCSAACSRKPGWFLPGEAEKAAALLHMPIKEFFKKFLAIDWWNGEEYGQEVFVLAPALVGHPPGEEYPMVPTGACIFYKNKRCMIHDAKPFECQMYWHEETATSHGRNRHKAVADAWRDHQNLIVQIFGSEPVAPEPTILDMFGFMSGMLG